jgi:hypothetical protein
MLSQVLPTVILLDKDMCGGFEIPLSLSLGDDVSCSNTHREFRDISIL